jgi:hypothetical protein
LIGLIWKLGSTTISRATGVPVNRKEKDHGT